MISHRHRSFAIQALAICAAALATPVLAQENGGTDSADYDVVGSTPVVCALQLDEEAAPALSNFSAADANVYRIDELVSAQTLSTRAASFEVTLEGVCNSAHRLRVESLNNGLWQVAYLANSDAQGFATAVPYAVSARWSDRELRLEADGRIRSMRERIVPIARPVSGEMVLRFDIDEGATNLAANAPLVAGSYVDTLTVVLEPQQ